MSKNWDPRGKPPANICPQQFCYFWSSATAVGQCDCSFGICTRLDPHRGNHDWYEPNEPQLKRHGLPWFYFVADAEHLDEDAREAYIQQSKDLWKLHSDTKLSHQQLVDRINEAHAEPPDEDERAFLAAARRHMVRAAKEDPWE